MTDPLGLSIGMTNLVAARIGRPPVMRRAVLTLFATAPPRSASPRENPNLNQPGMVLSGSSNGSAIRCRWWPPTARRIAASGCWSKPSTRWRAPSAAARLSRSRYPRTGDPRTVGALRGALRAKPSLAPDGVPAALIPDSVAALSALQAAPGLPSSGVVVLCDFGGSGTSVTLADAGSNFAPSAKRSAIQTSPATRSTRRCSTTSSPASPKPTTPIRRAPRRSAHWPGCATRAGRPRNGCRPRPPPRCPSICPASTPTSG